VIVLVHPGAGFGFSCRHPGVKGSLQNIAEPSHTDVPLSLTLLNLPLNAHACLQGMVRGRVGVQPACKAVTGALKERVRRSGVFHTALGVSTHAGGTSYLCGIMLYVARTLYLIPVWLHFLHSR